jgi:D-alanyl-D-alanine carboxypeptidase
MPFDLWSLGRRAVLGVAATLALGAGLAQATPYLVVDADSGQVLMDNEATAVWYPASLTKLMTVYVALDAVRNGRLTLDTPLVMSLRAARMAPSKMGFRPGTEVTLDNALKMLMVKSPNDVAVMIAEGISGSVEAFADEMNAAGQRLGLHESHFVNPNGLHDPGHVSSARDMAIIARALLREFPDHADLFSIGALQLGNQYIANHNGLLGRYPGADGMKTGFTCPAGFNVVASANHGGRRLIVVVLGSPSTRLRNQEAADLFDRGFAMSAGTESLDTLPPGAGAPDPRANICLHRSAAMLAATEEAGLAAPAQAAGPARGVPLNPNPLAALLAQAPAPAVVRTILSDARPHFDPVRVFIGPPPGWTGPVLGPRPVGAGAATAAAAPDGAKAFPAEAAAAPGNAQGVGAAAANPVQGVSAANPPAEAQGDAKAPFLDKAKPKLVRHAALHIKVQKASAVKSVKAKVDDSDKAKIDNTDKDKVDSTDKDKKDLSTD